MATLQMLKTRNAETETVTKTAIDQKQSLEVVQTLLHGGLSSLSYLRCFFAEKAFDEQVYGMSDKIHSYDDYAAGRLGNSHWNVKTPKTVMRILRRSRSKRADMFLDWLEKGAFAALQAGNLQALQVYVHADPGDREKVIETYTFTIKYKQHANQKRTPSGLEMDKPGSDIVSVQLTNAALQSLLQQIMKLCGELPDLPEERFISMALFYMDDVRKDSVPSGFVPSITDRLFFAQAEGWEKQTETLKELVAGFHSATLKVSHLQQAAESGYAKRLPITFPEAIEYGTESLREDDIDQLDGEGRVFGIPEEEPAETGATDERTPSTIIIDNVENIGPSGSRLGKTATPLPASDPPGKPFINLEDSISEPRRGAVAKPASSRSLTTQVKAFQIEDSLNTQSSQIAEMKSALANMMHPEHITQGDTQMQQLAQQHNALSETTETPSGRGDSAEKTTVTGTVSPMKGSRPALSPTKTNRMKAEKKNLRNSAHQLAQKAGSRTKSGQIILCQCGYAKEEGDMVQCSCCDTWQHLHCYGYIGNEDARLPTDHVCYWCLLGSNEKDTFKELMDLAVKRRGMHLVMQKGLKSQTEFADEMGLESWQAGPVYGHIRKSGYVVGTAGSHKAGFKATGRPLYVPVKEGPSFDRMMRDLFDPMTNISHHYQLPPTYDTQKAPLHQRLISSKLTDMAPPTTPASARRKQKAAATPASGLDLPTSTTPFETPSRTRDQQVLTKKRSMEAEEEVATTAQKRRATPGSAMRRLRSVQTEFMLDAAGLPSSPANSFQ